MTAYLSWRVILPLRNDPKYPQVPFPWLNTKLQANLILRKPLPQNVYHVSISFYVHLWINQTQEMQPSHDNIAPCANKNSCIVSVAPSGMQWNPGLLTGKQKGVTRWVGGEDSQ